MSADEMSTTPAPNSRSEALAELRALRGSIDNIDAALIHMLAERFRCTKAVGELKARSAMPAADPERETQQVARLRHLAREARLDPDFAEKFLTFVVREVIRHHEAIAREGPPLAMPGRETLERPKPGGPKPGRTSLDR